MSTLSVTNINSPSGTTDLTLLTGNAAAGDIVLLSGGGLVLAANSVQNTVVINTSTVSVSSNLSVNGALSVSNLIVGNLTVNNSVINSLTVNGAVLTTNGTMTVSSNLSIAQSLLTGNVTTIGTMTVSANLTVNGVANVANVVSFNGPYQIKSTTLSAGNNHNINCASGNYFIIVANSSSQNVYFTNAPTGVAYSVTLRFSNGAGGNTISWANTPRWPSATAPTPSTNNDIWVFITDDGGANWRGNLVQKDSR